ncbi:MAG: YCF48-related protein, partial [Chloroflexota bacterium]
EQWLAIAEMTTDGGLTWTTIFQQEGFALTDIDFVNRNEGWVSGYYATGCCQANSWIYHTTDGGLTWEQQFFGKEGVAAVQAIHFFNRREGWLAGYEAPQALNRTLLYHTTDGGATWVEMDFHPFADPFDLFFFDESEGWAVGPNSAQQGKFLHYTDPTRQPKVNLEVTTHPDSYTPGTQLAWTLHIENVSGEAQTTDVWVYLSSPAIGANSPYPIRLAQGVTLPADLDTTRTLRLTLPGWLPAGFYNVETIIGPFASDDPLQHLAYDSFDVEFLTSR